MASVLSARRSSQPRRVPRCVMPRFGRLAHHLGTQIGSGDADRVVGAVADRLVGSVAART